MRLNHRTRMLLVLLLLVHLPTFVRAQGSRADYQRAATFEQRTRDKLFRQRIQPQWLPEVPQFWYRVDTAPNEWEFVFVDAQQGERRAAFDHQRLAAALHSATGETVDPQQLPFRWISLTPGATQIRFAAYGKSWRCDLPDYQLQEESASEDENAQTRGVDRLRRWRRSRRTGAETQVEFVNRTDQELQLSWIDSSGEQRSYGAIAPGKGREQHTYEGHIWVVSDSQGKPLAIFQATAEPGEAIVDSTEPLSLDSPNVTRTRRSRAATSPDGRWQASIRDHNLLLQDTDSDEEIALSSDGTEQDAYRPQIFWSPDSKKLVVMQQAAGQGREIFLIESAPADQLQPKLHTLGYDKPGDRLPVSRPRLYDLETRRQIPISDELWPTPWSTQDIRWHADSGRFTFLYNQRGHQVLRIVEVDATTGATRAIIDEQSETFLDYAHKQFAHYADATREIIWMSERDGWNHLYLFDADSGKQKNAITRGPWVVRGVERVDEQSRQIWFRAGGIRPDQDPYYVHLCRVNFNGSGLTVLTESNGTHEWEFSPDGQFLIDRWSRVDQPPVTELHSAEDGQHLCELERADWSRLLETGWQPPERFVATGRDGTTEIYGVIVRPTHFQPGQKYPVIERIYAGPQSAFVPKSFALLSGHHKLAELGFVVVQIDGMGTSHRSKAFHDVCWKNLADSGFPDRIRWLQAAAHRHSEIDLTRVGIYGGSAGGQSALRALLAHGDFYHVAVADCGCHDNRMDKVWWNELWMGWPIGPHYEEQSNVTQAHQLQGKLLLTFGELDRNVDPASTMQVVDALVKADKDFDLLIMPGTGHGAGERPYAQRRRMDFFVRHLLQVEPRWEVRPEGSESGTAGSTGGKAAATGRE